MRAYGPKIIGFAAVSLWALLTFSHAEALGQVISIQFENDFFGGDSDRHFTHGTRMEWLSSPIGWLSDEVDQIRWLGFKKKSFDSADALETRVSLSIGQNIYTPEDTTAVQWVPHDRPYAGWLYVGFGLEANQGSRRCDKLGLEIGMVGPDSFAENVQNFWHSLFGLNVPKGWNNQLDNEPGLVLSYEQIRRYEIKNLFLELNFDLLPNAGGSLGNVFTYAEAGLAVRLGSDLTHDFGPPRIRPGLPGSSYFRPKKDFLWYVFAGFQGRAVLRNIFLDGNTFRDSHSVEKKPFVGDLQAGLVIQWESFRISYTQVLRTKEFEGQDVSDVLGSLSLSYYFQ
jgi:lipid A 3-O-deacylase